MSIIYTIIVILFVLIVYLILRNYQESINVSQIKEQRYQDYKKEKSTLEKVLASFGVISLFGAFVFFVLALDAKNDFEATVQIYRSAGSIGGALTFFVWAKVLEYLRISSINLEEINKKLKDNE